MPIHHWVPVIRSFKPALPSRHLLFLRHSSSMLSRRPLRRGFRLSLVLDKPSSIMIDSLVARFGGFAISNSNTLKYANAALMNYMPAEHEALYQEVVKRVCKETYKFPMGYGCVWVFPKITTVALMFKPPHEVQSILRQMSKAIDGLPGVEGIKIYKDLMVPVWHVSFTDLTRAAAIHEAWAFKDLFSEAYPHGVRLGLARGLILRERAHSETTPRTIPFTDPPPSLYMQMPKYPKDSHGRSIRRLSPTPGLLFETPRSKLPELAQHIFKQPTYSSP